MRVALALCALLSLVSVEGWAQTPDTLRRAGLHEQDLARVAGQVNRSGRVRLRFDGQLTLLSHPRLSIDGLLTSADDTARAYRLGELSRLEVRRSAAGPGALIGGIVMASDEFFDVSAGQVIGGTLAGAFIGALVGGAIGSVIPKWKTVYRH